MKNAKVNSVLTIDSTIGFHLLWQTVKTSREYSSLFIIVINLIFVFSL